MASLQTRLLITLLYSDSFDFPLSAGEWVRRLYGPKVELPNESLAVVTSIAQLSAKQRLRKDGNFFAPIHQQSKPLGRQSSQLSLPAIRSQRLSFSQQKLAEIAPLITFCRRLPWVVGVASTGSVAVDNARENDDVDFMIVCSPRRLWLVRPLLIFFSQLYGKRRTWHGEEGNSWCFNLWLEPTSLGVSFDQRSLYTAYEVCQTRWLISKEYTKEWFFVANKWASEIIPFLYLFADDKRATFQQPTCSISLPIVSNFLDGANYLSFIIQYKYMRRRITRERVSRHFAAFHPRDTRGSVMGKIMENMRIF